MDAANIKARRLQADQDMIESLTARGLRSDREAVEEEELDEHPLLASTSVMHYLSSPSGADDFPGYNQKVARWGRVLGEQAAVVETGRVPFYFDVHKYLSSMAIFEYIWRGREAFTEMIIEKANQDVIGYWFKPAMALAVEGLMALCVATKGGIMLCEDPSLQNTVIFRYEEVDRADSRFSRVCQMIQEQFLVPTFFMHDFDPSHVEKIRRRFPASRIVGICCPAVDVEKKCLAILKARKHDQDQPQASRSGNKYGSDWSNSDQPTSAASGGKRKGQAEQKK